jgi:hypothetical protein
VICTVALLIADPESAVFSVAVVVVSATFALAFNRYLGWRPPS